MYHWCWGHCACRAGGRLLEQHEYQEDNVNGPMPKTKDQILKRLLPTHLFIGPSNVQVAHFYSHCEIPYSAL